MRTLTKDMLDHLTPDMALEILREGNERFVRNMKANRNLLQQVNETSEGQFPCACILSCIDSRTSAELIFDQGLGDIFSIRVAGNILNDDILGSMEFACKIAGSKLIIVLGHTKCGAITGACNNVEMGHVTGLLRKISPAIEMEHETVTDRNGSNKDFLNHVSENNVRLTTVSVREQSEILRTMEKQGQIKIIGGIYDVDTGRVNFHES